MTSTPAESAHEGQGWIAASPRLLTNGLKIDPAMHDEGMTLQPQPVFHLASDDSAHERDMLYQTIREQASHVDRLSAYVDSLIQRQRELRTLLLEAHEQLIQRDTELEHVRERIMQHDAEAQQRSAHLYGEILQRDAAMNEFRAQADEKIRQLSEKVERESQQLRAFRNSRLWRIRLFVKRITRI
jgi:hypothetical protein